LKVGAVVRLKPDWIQKYPEKALEHQNIYMPRIAEEGIRQEYLIP